MSNSVPTTHPAVVLRSQYRQLRSLLAVMLVAVVGLTATVVVLAVDEDQPVGTVVTSTHPAQTQQLSDPFEGRTQPTRENGKPDESATAASISQAGSRSYPTLNDPFQSQVEQPRPLGGPDESAVATAISPQTGAAGPDESKIAAAIGKHSDVGPEARARAYQEALRTMTPEQLERAYGVK